MSKTGVFYGPEKGSVGKAAQMIAEKLHIDKADMFLVKEISGDQLNAYDKLIFGISTLGRTNWDSDHKDDDWDVFYSQLNNVDWEGKTVAIYGLGDYVNYPNHFVDAIGWLYEKLIKHEVKIVGFCDPAEYIFDESEAVINNSFVGLPLDEDNEPEKTDERLTKWLNTLKGEYGF